MWCRFLDLSLRVMEKEACFDMFYPTELQKNEEEICKEIRARMESINSRYQTVIRGIIWREHFNLHRQYKKISIRRILK